MRMKSALPYGLALFGLLGLSFAGWTHLAPAAAQRTTPRPRPAPPMNFQPPMPPGPFGFMGSIAANNSYVYVLRGNMVVQLRASNLAIVTQKPLPMPQFGGPGGPPARRVP